MVSPGEAIIPRSLMGKPEISAIVDAILSGKIAPKGYFQGSVTIGGTSVGVSDEGVTVDGNAIIPVDPIQAAEDAVKALWSQVKDKTFGMVMEMFKANSFHTGGLVPSFAAGGEVPSLLQSGEYVLNRGAVGSIGTGLLDRINSGKTSTISQNQQPTFNISIDIKTTEPLDETYFRQKVWPKVQNELKRSSLNGDFVISSKGIRT
jgi:hypothetical protein